MKSAVLKWNSKSKQSLGSLVPNGKGLKDSKGKEKQWIHNADTLINSKAVYVVKFMGKIDVDKSKGIEVVKEAIQRIKFNQQLKKSEGAASGVGSSTPQKFTKIELSISVNGVIISNLKSKEVLHEYPLHHISYCADDKNEKRFFSFIAKASSADKTERDCEHSGEFHVCFVFVSDKLAEEITLTIGQAFDLGYKQYLNASDKEKEMMNKLKELQKEVSQLTVDKAEYKKRLEDVELFASCHKELSAYMISKGIEQLSQLKNQNDSTADKPSEDVTCAAEEATKPSYNSQESVEELICLDADFSGSKMVGIAFQDPTHDASLFDDEDDFDPRASDGISPEESSANIFQSPFLSSMDMFNQPQQPALDPLSTIIPPLLPPRSAKQDEGGSASAFGGGKFNTDHQFQSAKTNPFLVKQDPFGMNAFGSGSSNFQSST